MFETQRTHKSAPFTAGAREHRIRCLFLLLYGRLLCRAPLLCQGALVAAAVLSCVAHTPSAAAPHSHSTHPQGSASTDVWSPLGAYLSTASPSGVPTGLGAPDGAGWGYGCTSVCQGDFDEIEDLFDDFVSTSHKTLKKSFKSARTEIEKIVDDAAALVLAKVQTKAAAVSHQHARLDATYKVPPPTPALKCTCTGAPRGGCSSTLLESSSALLKCQSLKHGKRP